MYKIYLSFALSLFCVQSNAQNINFDAELAFASKHLLNACKAYNDTVNAIPRTAKPDGTFKGTPSWDWTSGFFGGNLWYAYEATGNKELLPYAQKWTNAVWKEQYTTNNHDVGFMIYCSYGNMYRLTKDKNLPKVIVQAAKSLCTRFNPTVGCIQSWDGGGWNPFNFPVIIDNMMNLELLFEATKLSKDSTYWKIAVIHANTTLKNHFREDGSSYHVVDYMKNDGSVRNKTTFQGLSYRSAWARGQGWGLYGYTLCYRYTKNSVYLEHAKKIAAFWMNHKNLPTDLIPYWDLDAPGNSCSPRDASAAALVASALLELSTYTGDEGKKYKEFALKTLASLATDEYKAKLGENNHFIIKHCTGAYPFNSEIDVPLVYADYYYLEALLRAKRMR